MYILPCKVDFSSLAKNYSGRFNLYMVETRPRPLLNETFFIFFSLFKADDYCSDDYYCMLCGSESYSSAIHVGVINHGPVSLQAFVVRRVVLCLLVVFSPGQVQVTVSEQSGRVVSTKAMVR